MTIEHLELQLLRLARLPRAPIRDATRIPVAKEMLQDEETTASGCVQAIQLLYGDNARAWEPETLWLTLDRESVDVPLVNRDKILAAFTLLMLPAFWWEVNAYENTVMAFNNQNVNTEGLQEATPAQLSWAVYEAELLFTQSSIDETPEFDLEPVGYTAVVLHRAGFLRAPELLSFSQRALDRMNGSGALVSKKEVETRWKELENSDLSKLDLSDSPLDLQIGRLASVNLYLQERGQRYEADLHRLRGR